MATIKVAVRFGNVFKWLELVVVILLRVVPKGHCGLWGESVVLLNFVEMIKEM